MEYSYWFYNNMFITKTITFRWRKYFPRKQRSGHWTSMEILFPDYPVRCSEKKAFAARRNFYSRGTAVLRLAF